MVSLSVLNVKAVVAAFNQEKAPVGAFSVITNLRMDFFEALLCTAVMLVSRLMELTQYQLRRMRELGPRFHLLHPGGDPEMVNICFWWINLI